MEALQKPKFMALEPLPMNAPDESQNEQPRSPKMKPRRRDRGGDGLARTVLARLPLAVAVIDADATLLYWNEQAALLFSAPPHLAEDRPKLADMLPHIGNLANQQRERIAAFAAAHIASGDRTEPDGCLRISLDRSRRLAVQIHGIGAGRWMLVFDEGTVAAASNHGGPASGDAWLDSLTGLSNRRHFEAVLHETLTNATVETRQAILLIDLDRFAPVNENFGHAVGDALLCLVAQRLRREVRDDDLLARLGGDEFVVLMPNGDRAETLAVRAIEMLSKPFLVEGHLVSISAGVGIVRLPQHGVSADGLMSNAELALYQAKSAGGRTWRQFDPTMANEARVQRNLETDLRKALTLGELSVLCQPYLDGTTHTLRGFEVQLRWDHPSRGIVPAALFQGSRCSLMLGEWTLEHACAEAADWPAPLAVAVRVSPAQLQQPDGLTASVRRALEISGLAPDRLELRVPQAFLPTADVGTLRSLRAVGVRVTLLASSDGPALAEHLRQYPFHGVAFAVDAASLGAPSVQGCPLHDITCYAADPPAPLSGRAAAAVSYHPRPGRADA